MLGIDLFLDFKKPIQIVGDIDQKTRNFVHVNAIVKGLL
jgi:hypothetical protein